MNSFSPYLQIRQLIQKVLFTLNWNKVSVFSVQINRNLSQGEFNSNIAKIISAKYNLPLSEVTQKLQSALYTQSDLFEKIEIHDGYLNFFWKSIHLNKIISYILKKGKDWGRTDFGNQEKINYEWISANPTGYFHLGHLRNAVVGDVLARVFSFAGFDVTKEYYINDAGVQIFALGKSIFYHYAQLIGLAFADFDNRYKNQEIISLAKEIYQKYGNLYKNVQWNEVGIDERQNFFIEHGRQKFLKIFKQELAHLGIQFDVWFSEKSLYEGNFFEEFKVRIKKKNLTYEKDGALFFKASQFGAEQDFVLVKRNGEPSYFSGDLMYHENKFQRGFSKIYDLWGADHHAHYFKIKAGMKALGWPADNFQVDFIQMISVSKDSQLKKMSKRAGTAVYWREFVHKVGVDLARFMMILRQRTTKFVFDFAILQEKNIQNPVYYTQYAHARACQVINKNKNLHSPKQNNFTLLGKTKEEKDLILHLHRFPQIILNVVQKHEPQFLISYLIEISKKFHAFYQKHSILKSHDELARERIALVHAFRQTAANIFSLIGVSAPTKMTKLKK